MIRSSRSCTHGSVSHLNFAMSSLGPNVRLLRIYSPLICGGWLAALAFMNSPAAHQGHARPLYLRLKQRAAEHRRSLNSEILVALEQVVATAPPDPKALLTRVDAIRSTLRVSPLTEAGLRTAKAHGRR
jgi:hypothetical protein